MNRIIVILAVLVLFSGCQNLRFGATQNQKQNAWVHQKTTEMAADVATSQGVSSQLQGLTRLSELQSQAFVADYGLPTEYPSIETYSDIMATESIATDAITDSSQKPDTWDVLDGAMDAGIGIAGLLGGVWGVRVAGFLRNAQKQSQALKEVVLGNELFKAQNTQSASEFKKSHVNQSAATKQIVSEIKNS